MELTRITKNKLDIQKILKNKIGFLLNHKVSLHYHLFEYTQLGVKY